MKPRLLWLIPLLILTLLLGIAVRPVKAHANLLQSAPEANAALERPPAVVELFFSEPIEPSFSTIEVLDGNGRRVDNEDAQVDPAEPTRMTVSLRSLTDGVFTVSWRTLSSVDSHVTAGAFPFALGDVDAAVLEAAAQATLQVKLSPGEVIVRWLTFLSSMALVGGQLFILMVWQPACRIAGVGSDLRPPWRRVATIALLLLIGANILWLLFQAGQASGREFALPWDVTVSKVLFTTRFGALWLGRMALALALVWLVMQAQTPKTRWMAFIAGLLLLLTISLGSHAAAQPKPFLPLLSDWIHLAAASVWVGGLIHFVVGLNAVRSLQAGDSTRLTAVLIPRFSALALISVALLVLTGLIASILQVGTFGDLTGTTYGRTLLFKLALILPMLMLGAMNLFITTPAMRRAAASGDDGQTVSQFRRLVTVEVTLGVAVLLSVGVLTTLPPSRIVATAPKLSDKQEVDDLEISLEVTPGRPGLNTFLVKVSSGGKPVDSAREVSLQFTPATVELPASSAQLAAQGDGEYTIEGGYLALPDAWQVQVAVRREGAFDTFANFDFTVGTTAAVQTFSWQWVSGLLLVAAGLAYWFALVPLVDDRRRVLAIGRLPAVMLALAGLVVIFNPPGVEETALVNPIPPNADSIAVGAVLYDQNCTPCHGSTGAGDGPVGRTLNPPPADLSVHTAPGVHPDGRLYGWITEGFPDSVMPAFKEQLTDEQRWHLVNYIRTLAIP